MTGEPVHGPGGGRLPGRVAPQLNHHDVQHFTRMSTLDFSSLYTTIRWSDVSLAYRYWHQWYKQCGQSMDVMSDEEVGFMDMLFR